MADVITEILQAAGKHPNSRVSKLIRTVHDDPSQKNIVLLLIELAEHSEYSIDFNISLKYYLELFDSFGINSDLVLNEAGLLLLNSSKIYSKRVDYVQSLVERQILTLSNADHELQQQQQQLKQQESSTESTTPVEKPKKGRKRALEVSNDPYEIELAPKKFKKLSKEKRFSVQKTAVKAKSIQRNIEMEQHIHPAGWMHATIYDLENEEDVDTKRNYKLFTYHVEHRYNTLVPDINFRLHFKVKDYIDAQTEEIDEDEACNTDRDIWPPLSEAYIQKYLKLENYVLQQDMQSTKRKPTSLNDYDDDGDERENTEVLTNDIGDTPGDINQEKQLNDTANNMEITVQHLNTSMMNDSKNDSGLGQSLLDDSNKTDTSLDTSKLDTLDSSITSNNLNDINSLESDKSLNLTQQTEQENDSALGTSLLDQTSNTELNSLAESSGNLDTPSINNSNIELNSSTESSTNLDSTNNTTAETNDLSASLLDQTNNAELNSSTATSENLDSTNCPEILNQTTETSDLSASLLDQTNNQTELNSSTESNENLEATKCNNNESIEIQISGTVNKSQDNDEISNLEKVTLEHTNDIGSKQLSSTTEVRKDSALSDDRHFSISTENLAESCNKQQENAKKLSDIDIVDNKDGDHSQIRIKLPNMDDEGVYLSDLEEHDQSMLSPTINVTNILPGVKRKDVTIIMDEELRQALELRDGIMEHFGRETYNVPVTTKPEKQKLYFNFLKLPEKIIRKKVLFKLGPDMDLFLQARSHKRQRIDPKPREYGTTKLLQWFALNNTDMSGINMTPPNSPGHCSDFCGFTDDESDDDDNISCAEFCGFSTEEQAAIQLTNLNRLSRDSGVGFDVNQLTPEKETLDVVFETQEESVSNLNLDNCKKKLNFDETNETNNESTENILNQLSTDIRAALNVEINEEVKESTEAASSVNQADTLLTDESVGQKLSTELENSTNNSEVTETLLSTETNSSELKHLNASSTTEETEKLSSEHSSENSIKNVEQQSSETLLSSEEQLSDVAEKLQESTRNLETTQEHSAETKNEVEMSCDQSKQAEELNKTDETNHDVEISCDQSKQAEDLNKTVENQSEKTNCDANNLDRNAKFNDHHADDDSEDSEDETFINLDAQGNKTKIQLWHEHLQPILAKSRERHHFDVFKLGTEIIETVQSRKQTEEESMSSHLTSPSSPPIALFQDIMDNKDKSYVSRYFLSTLLLANQSNVEISINNKSPEHPSSWNDIQLKLLSTKRHTVAIEDNIGMINNNKKIAQKEKEANIKTKSKGIQQTPMEVDEEEDTPLVKLQLASKTNKKSKMSHKRISDNKISAIAEKRPKETFTTTPEKSSLMPNESFTSLITNVQILPTLEMITNTTTTNDHTSFSFSLPHLNASSEMPCTSRQAKDLQALEVNLDTIRTLQPIQKVPRSSDDIDSGIFSIDELST